MLVVASGCETANVDSSAAPDAGVTPPACTAGEVALEEGGCRPAGVAACAAGFESDGAQSCTPVLPAQPCPAGQMAVPGDVACHEVAPCGTAPFGDAPIEPSTQFVDASYAGGASDGTQAKPWKKIDEAIAAAAPGAVVAIAAGSYTGVVVEGKPVRLWGRCPSMVEIVGTPMTQGVLVRSGASGSEVHRVAVRNGILSWGSRDVLVEGAWIHDAGRGIEIADVNGSSSLVVRSSLVEQLSEFGLYVTNAELTLEGSVVRDVRFTTPGSGRGLEARFAQGKKTRPKITLRRSLFERTNDAAILSGGAELMLEGVVVRDTRTRPDGGGGRGIGLQPDPSNGVGSTATILGSVVERTHEHGIYVSGSEATIESTVVRDTLEGGTMLQGRGLQTHDDETWHRRANVVVRSSVFERNREAGVALFGSDVILEGIVVRDTLPESREKLFGRGIGVARTAGSGERSVVTLRSSIVERSYEVGLLVRDSDLTVIDSIVRDTAVSANHGALGDAIYAQTNDAPATVVVEGSRLERSQRAGIASFGAGVTVKTSTLECIPIPLNGEDSRANHFRFEDQGGNTCGCGGERKGCIVLTSKLVPPDPLPP
jgi:hypothetical protein